jgi:protein ImuB
MAARYISLCFPHLITDWFSIRRPALKNIPFVIAAADHGRKVITAANKSAQAEGISEGMVVADSRMLVPNLEVLDEAPGLPTRLLTALARWCIRYTPMTAPDPANGLILDATGCAHLWAGEEAYLREILTRLRTAGYDVHGGMADTIGAAWAMARYGKQFPIIGSGGQMAALLPLPVAALRLEPAIAERLLKLGLRRIGQISSMSRSALRRRFGKELLLRLDQAFGLEAEDIIPVQTIESYQERLPCLEPILTAGGIGIALTRLLETLCARLGKEGKGLRSAVFQCLRIDGRQVEIAIGTNRPSHHVKHLFRLFEPRISSLEPGPGIELFILGAPKTEELSPMQESLWEGACDLDNPKLSELLDRISNRVGEEAIHRYLPDEHHWPERSVRSASSLQDKPTTGWPEDRPRPIHLLAIPEAIQVTAPIPDYPPMLFRYKGKLHKILKADGPERIEEEWWIERARHRDYYAVEDEEGARYWLFRSGHYTGDQPSRWYIHGFFA